METISLTTDQLIDIIEHTTERVLRNLGIKAPAQGTDRISRTAMVQAIGRREFDRAVASGELKTKQAGNRPDQFNKIYADGRDWRAYLKKSRG